MLARRGRGAAANAVSKMTVFLLFLYFAECAAGSCISYGHACWGGHGKRSNGPSRGIKEIALSLNALADKNWFLSRLITSPLEVEALKDYNIPKVSKHEDYEGKTPESMKSSDESEGQSLQDFMDLEEDSFPSRPRSTKDGKIRLYKLLKSNAEKTN